MDISIILPCLDKEKTIGICVRKALAGPSKTGLSDEVVVVDNGSTDRSAELALAAGARVVHEERKGYGSADLRGISESTGRYLVFGDADDTCGKSNFSERPDALKITMPLIMSLLHDIPAHEFSAFCTLFARDHHGPVPCLRI